MYDHPEWDALKDALKHLTDFVAIGVTVGTIMKILPAVAAFLSIIWTMIRIYETKTVQKWLRKS